MSFIVGRGRTQEAFEHELPLRPGDGHRISLTFRSVVPGFEETGVRVCLNVPSSLHKELALLPTRRTMNTQKIFRLGVFGGLLLLYSASGMQVPKSKLPTRAPNPVSQVTSPVWVNQAPDTHASAASELWDAMCAICPSPDAELIESGGEMLQKMIEGRWINLESVWQAETKAPKLGALWKLCAPFPSGTRVDLYAYVKASFDVRCPRSAPLSPPLSVSLLVPLPHVRRALPLSPLPSLCRS